MASRPVGGARRCKKCTYVFDQDEWVCERCGVAADPPLAGILTRAFLRASFSDADLEELEEGAAFDADELGLDTEEED